MLIATVAAIAIAASTMFAQFGAFDPQYQGQLWGVRQELPSAGGYPAGTVFVGGTLFVADQGNQQVVAYDTTTWDAVDVAGGDWNDITTVGAPAFGLIVNEMARATVNGADAILISDLSQPRVLAFDTTGAHLFTLRLDNPNATPNDTNPLINGMAMGPGASFTLASGDLSLSGAFAAGWTNEGRNNGAALAFKDVAAFTLNGSEYAGTPVVLNGTEGTGVGVVAAEIYGVVFDSVGNLYTLDTLTERLNVYDSTNGFAHRFRFGTPATDNGVEEFAQPFGLAFWPDANGGRLFVADDLNNRIAVYRPNIAGNTLDFVTSIDRMAPAVDPQPFSLSIDPLTASIAVSDFSTPSVWILRTADLVAYDLQVLDNGGTPVDTVCAGAPYQVRVSLTVPAGHPDAANVLPLLTVGGTVVTGVTPVPADTYPNAPLQAGQVATYTFPLTMTANASGDIEIVAGASSTSTNDVLSAYGLVTASDCPANNAAPVITASQSPATQVSGWTPVYGSQITELTLNVTDDDAVQRLEYRLSGANNLGNTIPPVIFSGTSSSESVTVQLPEEGETTIEYRARDNNNVWSAWQSTVVRIVRVIDRQSNEGDQNTFTVGQSVGSGFQFSATNLPPGASIDQNTGQISGLLLFDAAGVYNVTVTETLGAATSSVNFTWTVLNVNRHPTITPLAPNAIPTITEGVPMTPIQITGFDPDGDTVFWTAYGRSIPLGYELPPGVAIDPATGIISGTFPMDSERAYNVTVGLSECAATSNDHPVVCAGAQPRIGLATLYEITLNVTNVNQPPDVIDPGDKTNAEGDTITPLQIVASDPDLAFGDDVDFEAEGLPPGLSIDPETGLITGTVSYTAGPHVYAVVIRARDTEAAQPLPFETFNWTITDAPPTITALPDRTDYEGDVINLSVVASDPGGAAVTYSATGLPHGLSINPTTGQVTGTIAYDAAGLHSVTVTVTKGGVSRSDTFIWTVLERNSQPTISAPDRINAEGDPILPVMVATATDPEGDVLIYSATGLPPGLVMLPTGLVSGVISPTGEGVYTVTVSVRDSLLGTPVSTTFTWTVTGVNRPPTITSVDQFSNEGDTVSYVVAGVDPDGDTLSYTMTGTLPATHTINPATGAITGTFSHQSAGVYTITVTTTDGQLSASTTFLWTVRDINRPPVVDPVNQFNREGDSASYPVSGSDPDGDTLVWTATGLPPGFTISSTGVISGTFGPGTAGVYTINVAVCDALLCATKPFVWTVGANLPPTVFHPNRTNVEGDTVSYATTASDPDGDTLAFTAAGLPPGISINPLTGQLTGTLGYNTAGTYNPTITVSDGRLTAAHTFNWIVTNTNRPPDAVNDVASVNQGQSVAISVLNLDSDPDGDTLTVTAITQPANGTAVLNTNGTVTYTAPNNFAGVTTFDYTITDGNGGTDTATVTVTVLNVNFPPVVAHPNRLNAEGDTVSYATTASDPDGDALTFTVTGLPAGISMNPSTGLLTGTLGYSTAGTYTPTITVSDGALTASHTFTWIVTETNRPPTAVDDSATTPQGQAVTIAVLPNDFDLDLDPISIVSFTQALNGVVTRVGNTFVYTPLASFSGTDYFNYTITDGTGLATARVTITVTPCADPAALVGAIARRVQPLNGRTEGNLQVLTAADVTFNSGSVVTGDLRIVGTPQLTINGSPTFGGTVAGSGATTPTSHRLILNGGSTLGRLVTATNAIALPTVNAPAASAGTRYVTMNSASDNPAPFATLRSLTLNSNVGLVTVPAGTYDTFIANDNTGFILGVAGDTTPAIYNFQSLTLNSVSQLQVVGPVIVTVRNSVSFNGNVGNVAHPEWLTLRISNGGVTLNAGRTMYGYVEAPNGDLIVNGGSVLVGGFAVDQYTSNANGQVVLRPLGGSCAVNTPPVVTNPGNLTDYEGQTISRQMVATDVDPGDTLTFSASGLPPGLSINAAGLVTGTLDYNAAGIYTVTLTVSDGQSTRSVTFTWTIINVNRPPVVTHPDRTNLEGDTVSYATTASDPDGDVLTYSATGLPAGITINPLTGTLTGTLGYATAGTYTPTITVSDGALSASHTFTWVVTNANRPPDAVNDSASVDQGSSVNISVLNLDTDPDNDVLTVTSITQPATGQGTAVLNPNGTVTYTAPSNFVGVATFTYTISDGNGGTDTATVSITVANVNFPPVVSHPDRTNVEGDSVTYATVASDPDGDLLSFSATGLPAGIAINPLTGTLTGLLGYNTAGTYTPTITVSDGSRTASHTFNWVVTNTNRPPDAVNDTASVNQGSSVTITVLNLDSDPDGDTLTVTAITQPAPGQGSAVLNANGTVTYSAPSNFAGTATFTYTISDGKGGTDTATVTVTVANVNFPPVVTHPNRNNAEGDTVTYATTASDPDGDALSFTVTGLPSGISINATTGALTGTLGYATAGTYTPTITVSDGSRTATHTFTWIVTNTNRPPDAVNDTATVNQGSSVNVTVLNLDSDPDGDTLSVTAITQPASGQGTAVLNANGTVTYTAPLNFVGTATFTYTISDGKGGTDTATVTVTVLALPVTCNLTGYVTYSQGGWGNNGAPGQLMTANFSRVYPGGYVIIGGTKTLRFTSASAITAFLPQGATPAVLTASAINPTSSSAGNFAAQVLALRLAVDYSNAGVLRAGLGDLVMLSGPFANQSVNQILATANAVLGGSTSSLPSGMTVSTLNSVIESLNLNFHEGTVNTGLLGCPAGPTVPTCVASTMTTTGNSSTSGTAGNVRTFTQGDVSVKVSAFARAKSNGAWTSAFLGAFSPGLGVTDGSEGNGADDSHKVDNVGDRVNYVLYEFSKPVTVSKFYLDYIGADADATVWVGTKTDPFNNHQTLSDAFLSGLAMTEAVDSGSSSARWVEFNGGDVSGNILVIAARPSSSNDAFKLGKLQFEACTTTAANQAPTVTAADRSDYKKAAVNVQITGADPNNDALTYTATGLPSGTSMSTAGLITGTPTTTGTYTVTVTVKDPSDATGTDTFVWTIQNHAPTLTTSNVTANVGQSLATTVAGSDLDNDTLTYSATGLPPGISMNTAGTFSGTLTTAGVYTVTITVKDSENATGSSTFTVTVAQPNRAPVAVNDSASTKRNTSVTINVLANDSDPDGDVLTVSLGGCANGTLTLNANKTIKFTPASNYKGTTTFSYTVSDGEGGTATATVKVTVVK